MSAVREVAGIEAVLSYEPIPDGVRDVTAWVDLESLTQTDATIPDYWSAEATVRVTVAVPQDADTKITAWDLAFAVAFHLRDQRWGELKTEPSVLVGMDRPVLADFEGDLDAVEIELSQQCHFRVTETGAPIENVYIGLSPDVGPDHIDDYERVGV